MTHARAGTRRASAPTTLNEGHLKALVLDAYRQERADWTGDVVANEFRLGETSVRVDLAILGPAFIGIEIKSERDSLKRLGAQVRAYTQYFDKVVVALSERHLPNLDWNAVRSAEVWSIDKGGRIRIAADQSDFPETKCLSGLLTSEQARRHGFTWPAPPTDSGRRAFESEFRDRFGQTSEHFQDAVSGREISADDLKILSRFRDRRETVAAWEMQRATDWEDWALAISRLAATRTQPSDHSSSVS